MSIQYFNNDDYPILIDWISSYILKLRNSGNFSKIHTLLKLGGDILGEKETAALANDYASEDYKELRMEWANLHYLLSDFSWEKHKDNEVSNLDEEIFSSLEKISKSPAFSTSQEATREKFFGK